MSNGENIAPQPIEDAIVGTSLLVDQAILLGQDQNYLSAFLVVNPAELARRGMHVCMYLCIYVSTSAYELACICKINLFQCAHPSHILIYFLV